MEGRYRVGNTNSPIAVCSMASVDMDLPMDRIAIMGKCVTENIGIEKIVKNIISNPKIRYLILCGQASKGHFVDNAIESLVKNGVNGDNRIIGAMGAMPVLKNLTQEEIERFRKQITPINLSGETDKEKIMQAVNQYFESKPQEIGGCPIKGKDVERISSQEDKDIVMDPYGFFIIQINPEKREILVEHHTNSGLQRVITGKTAREIYQTIIRLGLVSRMDHAAYLGKELAKAQVCMNNDLDYEQDSDIFISDGRSTNPERAGLEKRNTYTIAGGKKVVIKDFKKSEREKEFEEVLRDIGMGRSF